jgi:hypothetical protein
MSGAILPLPLHGFMAGTIATLPFNRKERDKDRKK